MLGACCDYLQMFAMFKILLRLLSTEHLVGRDSPQVRVQDFHNKIIAISSGIVLK